MRKFLRHDSRNRHFCQPRQLSRPAEPQAAEWVVSSPAAPTRPLPSVAGSTIALAVALLGLNALEATPESYSKGAPAKLLDAAHSLSASTAREDPEEAPRLRVWG